MKIRPWQSWVLGSVLIAVIAYISMDGWPQRIIGWLWMVGGCLLAARWQMAKQKRAQEKPK